MVQQGEESTPGATSQTRNQRTATTAQTDPRKTANPQEKGQTRWRTEDISPLTGPVTATGRLFVGAKDKHVYALSTDYGHTLWRTKVGAEIRRPVVVDGTVYVFANTPYEDIEVAAIDAKTGAKKWVSSGLTGSADHRYPRVANGSVYVQSAGRVAILDAATGKLTAKTNLIPDGPEIDTDRAALALRGEVMYVVGQVMDSSKDNRLIELDAKTGAVRDVRPLDVPDAVDSHYPPQYLALSGDTVIANQITRDVEGACICGFDVATGAHRWSVKTDGFENRYVVDGGTVFASLRGTSKVMAIEAQSGKKRWTKNLGSCCVLPVLGDKHVYIPNANDSPTKSSTIGAVSRRTGQVSWSVETKYASSLPVAVTGATVYYSDTNHGIFGVWTSG